MKSLSLITILSKHEPKLFVLLLLLQLFPIWSLEYFPTLDAAGHIYNGHILWHMWFGNAELYNAYFEVNTQLNPNWLSQFLLVFLTPIFQAHVCEKIMLSFYVIGFAVAFRMLVGTYNASKLLSYLIFFFIYNTTFIYGFLNYNFGLVFLLLCIYLLKRYINKPSWSLALWFALGLLLLFFSHLVAFGVFGLLAILLVLQQFLKERKENIPYMFLKPMVVVQLTAAFILPSALLLHYILYDSESANYSRIPPNEIWKNLMELSGNFCYSFAEFGFTRWIWILVFAGLLVSIVLYLLKRQHQFIRRFIALTSFGKFSLFATLILLALCFILPDSSAGGGGALTFRLVFLTMFFFSVFMFTLIQNKLLLAGILVILNVVAIDKLFYIKGKQELNQEYCATMNGAADYIEENAAMLCFDFNRLWPMTHIPKYAATKRNLILADNLGAHKLFSPVLWRDDLRLNIWMIGAIENEWVCDLARVESTMHKKIDYFLLSGACEQAEQSKPMCEKWNRFLGDSCVLIYKGNPDIKLYKREKVN